MRRAFKWLANASGQALVWALLTGGLVTAAVRAALNSVSAQMGLWWPVLLLAVLTTTYFGFLALAPRFMKGSKASVLADLTARYAKGGRLRAEVAASGDSDPDPFRKREHHWRMGVIDAVHHGVSPSKGFWIGSVVVSGIQTLTAAVQAEFADQTPPFQDEKKFILSRIDKIMARLNTVIEEFEAGVTD